MQLEVSGIHCRWGGPQPRADGCSSEMRQRFLASHIGCVHLDCTGIIKGGEFEVERLPCPSFSSESPHDGWLQRCISKMQEPKGSLLGDNLASGIIVISLGLHEECKTLPWRELGISRALQASLPA